MGATSPLIGKACTVGMTPPTMITNLFPRQIGMINIIVRYTYMGNGVILYTFDYGEKQLSPDVVADRTRDTTTQTSKSNKLSSEGRGILAFCKAIVAALSISGGCAGGGYCPPGLGGDRWVAMCR